MKQIIDQEIQKEIKDSYLDYAMSVIVGRALPDLRDGLKPVHRRVLYSMSQLNNTSQRPYLKSARIVGDVIGKYHPHGDTAVYGSIVRLVQDFSMRHPLIQGQGNFGSIDGDNAAAMRYTEIRLQSIADYILKDLEYDTVGWTENYDGSLKEPVVLPSRIPTLLVNGSSGIAVGMATNIPPHNLGEVMRALIFLLKKPEATLEELLTYIQGPDFPTGGSILSSQSLSQFYQNGRGIIQVRGQADIEEGKTKESIIIKEIPYQVNKVKLIEKIVELVNNKELLGVSDVRDESSREGMRIVIELKKNENAQVILNKLYKMTPLQSSFGMIFLSIFEGKPVLLGLKDILQKFIDFRVEIVRNRTSFLLKKEESRAHLLEGLKIVLENLDESIALIRASKESTEASLKLKTRFLLSDLQVKAILDMRLQKLTNLERNNLLEDYEKCIKQIIDYKSILSSEEKINNIIEEEFQFIESNFSEKRRTLIELDYKNLSIEDYIKNEEVLVTLTHKGYLKRLNKDIYKLQNRGGKGVKGSLDEEDDDYFTHLISAETTDSLLCFTSKGLVYQMKIYEIPEASRTSKGKNIVNFLNLKNSEKITEILVLSKENIAKSKYLIFATMKGLVKKTELSEYKNLQGRGLKAIRLDEDDLVVGVKLSSGQDDILLCSSAGKSIRFKESEARSLGRVSKGVRGIFLDDQEKVLNLILPQTGCDVLTITENGYAKRTDLEEYRVQSRAGKGVYTVKMTEKTGQIVTFIPVLSHFQLLIITNNGQVIKIKNETIRQVGRNTQGVRVINLKPNEKVVSVESVLAEDEE